MTNSLRVPAFSGSVLRSAGGEIVLFLLGAWCCVAAVAGPGAYGQTPDEAPPRYVSTQWTAEDGLPVNSVNDIAQGPDGYLWLATFDGLVRFDGTEFKTYQSGTREGLPSNRITNLLMRPDGLWMETESWHIVRFQDGTFTTVAEEVDTFHEGADGTLWMGNDKGAWVWRDETFELVAEGDVQLLLGTADGTLWMATADEELYRRSPAGRMQRVDGIDGPIGDLAAGRNGRVWIGTGTGLYRWTGGRLTKLPVTEGPASVDVLDVEPDVGGDCLVSASEGIFRCTEGRLVPIIRTPLPSPAGYNIATLGPGGSAWVKAGAEVYRGDTAIFEAESTISSLHSDREGNVWIGTNRSGLFRLRRSPFMMYGTPEGLASSNVYPIEQRQDGSVWLGTLGGGLARVAPSGEVETYRPAKNGAEFDNVWALHEDRSGRLWVSGANARVCRLNGRDCARPGAPSPISARIRAFYEDQRGRLWAGSERGGLYRCDGNCLTGPDAWTQYVPSQSTLASPEVRRVQDARITRLPHPYVRTIHETPGGTLWFGTNGGGIARYAEGTFETLTAEDGLSSNLIRDIYQDTTGAGPPDVLWVVTEDQGLNRVKLSPSDTTLAASITVYRKQDGLYDNAIHQILKDDQGRFWISSNRGIFWVRTAELEAFARGDVDRIQSISYTTDEGLRSREANGGVQPAGLKAQDGRLWFPTQDGAAVVDPATIPAKVAPPPVRIEAVTAGDSTVVAQRPEGPLHLAAPQRNFEVEYTGIRLSNPEGVEFRYRLKGLRGDWRTVEHRRRAVFTNVPPGRYTFEVAARARGGRWNRAPAQMAVTVAPFFYETWWFYGLCALALGLIGYGGVRYRLYALRRREALLEEKVTERTQKLRETSAQLEALFERSPDMIKTHDAEGTILRANPRYIAETGYREENLIGMKVWELDPSIDSQEALELWGAMKVGDRHRFESTLRRKDGSTFPVEVHIRRLRLGGADRFMAISRDITERKAAEQELERENERLDRFASVLSHDLRNPLNVAQGRLQLAKEADGDPADHLSSVKDALGRMDEIIEDMLLLTWSEQDISPEDLEPVELAAAAREARDNVEAPDATFEVEASARLQGHEGRLRRLLENLFRNAVEHGGEAVTVTVGSFPSEDPPGGFFVEDDGPGIPEENRAKVLEGGYSSQEEGTGLGLSIVQGIAEAHGWSISVTEGRAGGARFEFRGVERPDE
jgi:PAS domain S-box-containing protein